MDKTVRGHVHRTARTLPVTERMELVPLVALMDSMVMTVRIVSIKYTFFRCFHCSRNKKFIKLYIRTAIAQSGLNAINKLFTMLNSTEN